MATRHSYHPPIGPKKRGKSKSISLHCLLFLSSLSTILLLPRAALVVVVVGFSPHNELPTMLRARAAVTQSLAWKKKNPITTTRTTTTTSTQGGYYSTLKQQQQRARVATSSALALRPLRLENNDGTHPSTKVRRYPTRIFSAIANATVAASSSSESADNILIDTTNDDSFQNINISHGKHHQHVVPSATKENLLLLLEGLTSRPKPGGTWRVEAPLDWATTFGGRSPDMERALQPLIRLQPGEEGYYDVSQVRVPKATIVRTKEQAQQVMNVLMNADPNILHACDTEVMEIDIKVVGPVGNGYVTCLSVYSGPEFDYGLGDGPGTALWVDNLDDACGILQEFKPWLEDATKLKVWHNYGFDRHVLWNEGINCLGFGGDTMHMARLQDTSRAKMAAGPGQGYGLEALTADILNMRKRPMKEIFGIKRLRKDGSEGSLVDVPAIEILQRDPQFRSNFIMYSCYDAEGTWRLQEQLALKLKQMPWVDGLNLYDYYWHHMREFGQVLTDMERRGIRVDAKEYLFKVEQQARKDRQQHLENFRQWAEKKIGPDGLAMNSASSTQLGTFLFGGAPNAKTRERTERERVFKVARAEIPQDALDAYRKRDEKQGASNKKSKNNGTWSSTQKEVGLCRGDSLLV
jgi:hypothetical protein